MTEQSNKPQELSMPTQFALHLMASLVGSQKVEKYLLAVELSPTIRVPPVYWRTPVLLLGETSMAAGWNIVFVDVSMAIKTASSKKSPLQVSIGVLRRDRKNSNYHYSQGLLTEEILKTHFECVAIDLESTAVAVVAKSMATAVTGIVVPPTSVQKNDEESPQRVEVLMTPRSSSTNSSFALPLHYHDVEESGDLTICMTSDCALNKATATMVMANLQEPLQLPSVGIGNDDGKDGDYDVKLLEENFVLRWTVIQENATTMHTDSPDSQTSSTSSPTVRTSPSAAKPKSLRPPRGGGVRAMGGNRRKRAKTLSYGGSKSM